MMDELYQNSVAGFATVSGKQGALCFVARLSEKAS